MPRGVPALRKLLGIVVVLAGAAVTILPVTVRNRVVGGEWILIASNGGVNFYIGNNPQADGIAAIVPGTRPDWQGGYEDTHRIPELELGRRLSEGEVSRYWSQKAWQWIRAEPLSWLKLTLHKFRLFWSPVEIGNNQAIWFFARLAPVSALYWIGFPIAACLGMAGLVLVGGQWRTWSLPVLFLVLYMGSVVLFFCPARYRLPIVPVLILLMAHGVGRLAGAIWVRHWKPLVGYGLVAGLVAAFLATNPPDRAKFRRDSDGMGHADLGRLYGLRARQDPRQFEVAFHHFQEAVRLRPTDATVRIALASCYALARRMDEAGEQFRQAVALEPNNPECHLRYGDYLDAIGRPAEAEQAYRRAVELAPARADARYELGNLLIKLHRLPEAADELRAALELNPNLPQALANLAWILHQRGERDEALRLLRRALQVAQSAGQAELARQIEARLQAYGSLP